jgi:hypothetical protein
MAVGAASLYENPILVSGKPPVPVGYGMGVDARVVEADRWSSIGLQEEIDDSSRCLAEG